MTRGPLVFATLFALAGCATTSGATAQNDNGPKILTVGISAYGGTRDVTEDARTLENALTTALEQPVTVKVLTGETDLAQELAYGQIDAAWMPPLAFCQARGTSAVTPLAKVVRHGHSYYRSVLFTRTDNPAKTLADLKGARVAWVDRESASGYLFPRAVVLRAGLKPSQFFREETFLGDHKAVCQAVLDGRAELGATFADDQPDGTTATIDGCLQSVGPDATVHLRILAESATIPNDVFAVRAGFPPALAERLKHILLDLHMGIVGKELLIKVFKADSFTDANMEEFGFAATARSE